MSLRSLFALLVCAVSAAAQTDTYQGRAVVPSQVMVKLRAPKPGTAASVAQLLDADNVKQVGDATGPLLYHSRSQSAAQLMMKLAARTDLEYAEPNYVLKSVATPNDPSFSQLWGLNKIGAPSAWDVSTGGTGVVVAIVDTGVNYNHPDLAANIWSAPAAFTVNLSAGSITCPKGSHGFNAIAATCDPQDDNGHGTHVAGTIGAAGNNGTGVAGVNWTTRVMALKFLDSAGNGSVSAAIDAIEFAIQAKAIFGTGAGVRVLSASWGSSGFSTALYNEINRAASSEILFVAAAGNSSSNDDAAGFYPAGYNSANLISVAATDASDALASFSNFGKQTVHLGAPGVNILSTYQSGYAYLSGTSMATPHVSGAAALVAAACGVDTASVKRALLSNVDAVGALNGVTVTGGRLNVDRALRSCAAAPPPVSGSTGVWNGAAVAPDIPWYPDSPATLGMKFRSDVGGTVTGVRFYKGSSGNNGAHTGLLYATSGALLAQASFSGESASGWQTVTFSRPVTISPNTTYIVAYWSASGYADSRGFFTSRGVNNGPLHALQSGVNGGNSVYVYGGAPQFPVYTWQDSNYWVDVVFTPSTVTPTTLSLWSGAAVTPDIPWYPDNPVTLGLKFRSDTGGSVTGIRFWKGAAGNAGSHIAVLYATNGQLLAKAAFTGETGAGWQTVMFASPVVIQPNTTYIAAYWSASGYADSRGYFTSRGADNGPLHGLQSGVNGGNSVYVYGGAPQFPVYTWQDSNYWVDVLVAVNP